MEDGGKLAAGEKCREFGGRSGRLKWTSILWRSEKVVADVGEYVEVPMKLDL